MHRFLKICRLSGSFERVVVVERDVESRESRETSRVDCLYCTASTLVQICTNRLSLSTSTGVSRINSKDDLGKCAHRSHSLTSLFYTCNQVLCQKTRSEDEGAVPFSTSQSWPWSDAKSPIFSGDLVRYCISLSNFSKKINKNYLGKHYFHLLLEKHPFLKKVRTLA
jgi:hypothetical protein